MRAFEFSKGETVRIRGQAGEDDGEVFAVLDPDDLLDLGQEGAPETALVHQALGELGIDYGLAIGHRLNARQVNLFMAFHLRNGEWRDLSGERIFVFHHYGHRMRAAQ